MSNAPKNFEQLAQGLAEYVISDGGEREDFVGDCAEKGVCANDLEASDHAYSIAMRILGEQEQLPCPCGNCESA